MDLVARMAESSSSAPMSQPHSTALTAPPFVLDFAVTAARMGTGVPRGSENAALRGGGILNCIEDPVETGTARSFRLAMDPSGRARRRYGGQR